VHRVYLGGVMVKIEMRRMAAASHTLLTRHLGECIPPPQSSRGPRGTRPPTLQSQDFFFLTVGGRWTAPKSPKYARKRPTEHRKPTYQAPTPPRVRGACLAHAHAALGAWEPLGAPGGIKTSRSAHGAPPRRHRHSQRSLLRRERASRRCWACFRRRRHGLC